jgi:hypothetical protein
LDNRRKSVVRTMKALAIACCFVVGALPLGQVPNFVGRCGKSLCHCPVEQKKSSDPLPKHCQSEHFLTLSSSQLSGAEDTIALQDAFSAFVSPAAPEILIVAPATATDLGLQYSTARPPGFVAELSTPPPRQNA